MTDFVVTIAPGAYAFREAGGVSTDLPHGGPRGTSTCGLCNEWDDVTDQGREFTRRHMLAHDAIRPSVLGLDPSLRRAGLAIVSQHPAGKWWPSYLTHRGEDGKATATYQDRGRRLVRQARALMGSVDAARIGGADIRLGVIEGPIPGMTSGHAFDRGGLWWALYTGLMSRSIPIAVVTPAHREKFIAGVSLRPNARTGLTTPEAKKRILEETQARWRNLRDHPPAGVTVLEPANHDQADALGLADMGVLHLDEAGVPWRPRRRHVENRALVEWPQL
jgi:hypothetical protein